MSGMMCNRNISKSPTLRKRDEFYKDANNRKRVLSALIQGTGHSTALQNEGVYTAAEMTELADTWYANTPPGYWPTYELKPEIMNEGVQKALELSLNLSSTPTVAELEAVNPSGDADFGIPIVSYWLCAGHYFQNIVCMSDNEVTVLILTPSTPDNVVPQRDAVRPENIWIVTGEKEKDGFVDAATYGSGNHTVPTPVTKGTANGDVFVTQIYGENIDSTLATGLFPIEP